MGAESNYLPRGYFGRLDDAIAPHPIHHDGILRADGNFDMNNITWWILKNRGIVLVGPADLDIDVDWDLLITRMRGNLNTYWLNFTKVPRRIVWMLTDDGIQWAVLGVLRLFYTFNE